MNTLGDALPKEIERCKALVKIYLDLGPVGSFGAAMIGAEITKAQQAISNNDPVAMLRAYAALKECK